MRLPVVFEKFWLAILHKNKLVEFRSVSESLTVTAGDGVELAFPAASAGDSDPPCRPGPSESESGLH